jgi:hypothetical protein
MPKLIINNVMYFHVYVEWGGIIHSHFWQFYSKNFSHKTVTPSITSKYIDLTPPPLPREKEATICVE